jgi:hypothetical protein
MNVCRHDNTISLYFISEYGYQRINKIFNPVVDFSGRKCKIGHSADVEYHFRVYNLILAPFCGLADHDTVNARLILCCRLLKIILLHALSVMKCFCL